jgi:uncharacterized protein (TIGR02268 family)
MRSPRSALLLVPVLLAGAMPARAQAPTCQAGESRLELSAPPGTPAELCIHPDQFTTFLFDSPLAAGGVVLEGRTHFREVEAAGKMLVLVPSKGLPPGARLSLEVRFADGQVPQSARFTLVAHPQQAARQVEVTRARPAASERLAELRQLTQELAQCRAEVASLPARAGPALLLSLALARGLLNETGLTVHAFQGRELSQGPGGSLTVRRLTFYRTHAMMALQVLLTNEDPDKPWALAGASLLGREGEEHVAATVYPSTPLAPGATEQRWVEWQLPARKKDESRYTLRLWEASRSRTAAVPGLKLP